MRFSHVAGADKLRLDPDQAFPAQADWPVTASEAEFDQPFLSPDQTYTNRESREAPFEFQQEDNFSGETAPWIERSPTEEAVEPAATFRPADRSFSPSDSETINETFDQAPVDDSTMGDPLQNTSPEPWLEPAIPEPTRQTPVIPSESNNRTSLPEKTAPMPPSSDLPTSELPASAETDR